MNITIDVSNLAAEDLQVLRTRLADSGEIHSAMAGGAENYLKEDGADKASRRHKTADALGAGPTNHLFQAYQDIEGTSNASAASIWVPRTTRLRAAFGGFTARPGAGKTYLPIAATAAAYGKSPREVSNPKFLFPKKPGVARSLLNPKPRAALDSSVPTWQLVYSATIKEDTTLIEFDQVYQQAADAAELFILTGKKPS